MKPAPLAALVLALFPGYLAAQRLIYSTHDWNGAPGIEPDAWADVATPGTRPGQTAITYSVGTTQVSGTAIPAMVSDFSGHPVLPPPGASSFQGSRQAVILQAADPSEPDGISWQRYFYGSTPAQGSGLSNTARAISVAPALTLADTRIAICGTCLDEQFPRSASSPAAKPPFLTSNQAASGFIAVYNGDGDLLWCYPFFGDDINADSVVTDVSVRYDPTSGTDIVTYCGATNNGNFTQNPQLSTMTPVNPHTDQGLAQGTDVHLAGDQSAGSLQWDAFLGRIVAPHTVDPLLPPPALAPDSHTFIGGSGQDALIALAEVNDDEVVVVGVTYSTGSVGPQVFPLTNYFWGVEPTPSQPQLQPIVMSALPSYNMGIMMRYLFSAPNGIILCSMPIGNPQYRTLPLDVVWQGETAVAVGTTEDPSFTTFLPNPIQTTFNGSRTGFAISSPMSDLNDHPWFGTYMWDDTSTPNPRVSDSGCVGASWWNEYRDNIAIAGWRSSLLVPDRRICVASLFRANHNPTTEEEVWLLMRDYVIDEAATAPASQRLDSPGSGNTAGAFTFGSPTFNPGADTTYGGGVAVDEFGSVTVVGSIDYTSTSSTAAYPRVGPTAITRASDGIAASNKDAIRTVVDMLPTGTARTDDTGDLNSLYSLWYRTSGDGGTTPTCALSPFGTSLGTPSLQRMFIDVTGEFSGPSDSDPTAFNSGETPIFTVDRPPATPPPGIVSLGYLQLDLPLNDPLLQVFPGVEVWWNGSGPTLMPAITTSSSILAPTPTPLPPAPPGGAVISVQYIVWLAQPLCSNPAYMYAGTPALVLRWN